MNKNIDEVLKNYNTIIKENPVLGSQEEKKLLLIIYSGGRGISKKRAIDKLYKSNIRYVIKIALTIHALYQNIPLEDLINSGCVGISNAINKFDIKFNYKFTTYATWWIKKYIMDTAHTFVSTVSMTNPVFLKNRSYQTIVNSDINNTLSDKDIAKKLNVSQYQLRGIKCASIHSFSLDMEKEDGYHNIKEIIEDKKTKSPLSNLLEKDRKEILNKLLNKLPPRSRSIIKYRYLKDHTINFKLLGKKYNLSAERIRQIEYSGLKKLRNLIKNKIDI